MASLGVCVVFSYIVEIKCSENFNDIEVCICQLCSEKKQTKKKHIDLHGSLEVFYLFYF